MANTTGEKYGGRKKGTPNKDTKALREKVDLLISNNWEKIQNDITALTPKERVDTIVKLLEYSISKVNKSDLNIRGVEQPLFYDPEERKARIKELRDKIDNNEEE